MKAVGIIAEYNPFHTGHAYQIEQTRKLTNADCVIAVMSGNFVQRGEPAIFEKHFRSQLALVSGVDLVIELPIIYAVDGAKGFANGSVSLCSALPFLTTLSFGMEAPELSELQALAQLLIKESDAYQASLKAFLKKGEHMGLARMHACQELYNDQVDSKLLESPNNILALEYLMAMHSRQATFEALGIKRRGAGYHDRIPCSEFASATYLRNQLLHNTPPKEWNSYVTPEEYSILQKGAHPISLDDCSLLFQYAITQDDDFTKYLDVDDELSHRIENLKKEGNIRLLSQWIQDLKTKDRSYSQISRALLHILLGINKNAIPQSPNIPYIQVLGMNGRGREYLHEIKKMIEMPIITEGSSAAQITDEFGKMHFNLQAKTTEIYRYVYHNKFQKDFPDEYRSKPIIL